MAFRNPNTYSFAILQGTNSSRRSLDVNPDNFITVYLKSRLRPLIWDERDGTRSSTSRTRARESRLQSPVPESTSSVSVSVSGTDIRRQNQPLTKFSILAQLQLDLFEMSDTQHGDNLFAEHEDQFVVWEMKLSRVLDWAITSSLREASRYDCNSTRYQSKVRLIDKIRVATVIANSGHCSIRPLRDENSVEI